MLDLLNYVRTNIHTPITTRIQSQQPFRLTHMEQLLLRLCPLFEYEIRTRGTPPARRLLITWAEHDKSTRSISLSAHSKWITDTEIHTVSVEIDPNNLHRIDWDITLDQVQQAYDAQLKEWEQSDCRAQFLDIIDRGVGSRGWQFDKVVVLATAGFCQQSLGVRTRAMFQFICAVDLARELGKRGYTKGSKMQVFAQDPAYTEVDEELMRRLRVTKLEISTQDMHRDALKTAKDHLSRDTVLLDFGMPIYGRLCKEMCGRGVRVHVGVGPHALRHYPGEEGEALQMRLDLADRVEQEYHSERMPRLTGYPFFGFMGDMVHWRKTQEANES